MSLKISRKANTVTITQEVPVLKVKSGTKAITPDQALVNEYLILTAELAEVADKIKRAEEVKKALSALAKDFDPTEEAVIIGTEGSVTFSKAKNTTEITDKPGLIEKLGQEVFNEAAEVTITNLKKYLSENELACFTASGYGSRTLKAVTPKE